TRPRSAAPRPGGAAAADATSPCSRTPAHTLAREAAALEVSTQAPRVNGRVRAEAQTPVAPVRLRAARPTSVLLPRAVVRRRGPPCAARMAAQTPRMRRANLPAG